ncbi:expressed unknown protein [Seminavis robusta]|uniref:Uncharacterized protein n=1 Tax=Seminavis robusta TaxID=568900 RepID=A0A9N8DY61_9STRA|nr:expressed unknown protein [Seminavis robusta]|eukprot:Sro467_g148920.1 n/a (236) ;mRNA; f:24333-25040
MMSDLFEPPKTPLMSDSHSMETPYAKVGHKHLRSPPSFRFHQDNSPEEGPMTSVGLDLMVPILEDTSHSQLPMGLQTPTNDTKRNHPLVPYTPTAAFAHYCRHSLPMRVRQQHVTTGTTTTTCAGNPESSWSVVWEPRFPMDQDRRRHPDDPVPESLCVPNERMLLDETKEEETREQVEESNGHVDQPFVLRRLEPKRRRACSDSPWHHPRQRQCTDKPPKSWRNGDSIMMPAIR